MDKPCPPAQYEFLDTRDYNPRQYQCLRLNSRPVDVFGSVSNSQAVVSVFNVIVLEKHIRSASRETYFGKQDFNPTETAFETVFTISTESEAGFYERKFS